MTSRRDSAAIDRLGSEAAKAHPARVARVRADLEIEAEKAAVDAEALAQSGDQTGADAARSIAAAITRMYRALATPENHEASATPAEGGKADRPPGIVARPAGASAGETGDAAREAKP